MVRRLFGEAFGTALLLVVIVGSGVTASFDASTSSPLFQHALVVGLGLTALIVMFAPISGAHFNPAVTLVSFLTRQMTANVALRYVAAQFLGAIAGVVIANVLLALPAVTVATTTRSGYAMFLSEVLATVGLLSLIFGLTETGRARAVPAAVGAWMATAIYATPSAAFANPAVTVARSLTDTFTGIAPSSLPIFLAAQIASAFLATGLIRWLFQPAT